MMRRNGPNLPEFWFPAADLVAIDDHVTSCDVCRKSLCGVAGSAEALLSIRASLATPAFPGNHPEKSILQAYIDNQLDPVDYELTQSHIDFCPVCRQEIAVTRVT